MVVIMFLFTTRDKYSYSDDATRAGVPLQSAFIVLPVAMVNSCRLTIMLLDLAQDIVVHLFC